MKNNKLILIVDDEFSMRKNIVDILTNEGFRTIEAGDGLEAIAKVNESKPDVVLLDINMPQMDGMSALRAIKKDYSDLPIIMFTVYGTSERAIEAMKAGAFDYLEKPFELDELQIIINRAVDYSDLLGEVKKLRTQVSKINLLAKNDQLIGRNTKMQEIFKTIGRIAPTDATVLIQGESGTGKELVADAIQRHSLRINMPYVKVNCGALSETLLESEIFGHEKGSFTGAVSQRQGRFELANEGTIFLDEINNMPQSLQVRLLRILQNQPFYRVGGEKLLNVDVRVIAATNKNIEQEVESGNFRKDLFYRLNVVRLNIPPLRERKDDIPLLFEYFMHKYDSTNSLIVSNETMEKLQVYSWPGNVRELENTIQGAVVMAREKIVSIEQLPIKNNIASDFNSFDSALKEGRSFKEIVENVEKTLLIKALEKANWNRTQAAKILNIHRRLLYSKMKDYGIE
ncbi:MAG TPA: sigma-54 dependent transcriptional regulator [Ignavibacteriaceae bacterium]